MTLCWLFFDFWLDLLKLFSSFDMFRFFLTFSFCLTCQILLFGFLLWLFSWRDPGTCLTCIWKHFISQKRLWDHGVVEDASTVSHGKSNERSWIRSGEARHLSQSGWSALLAKERVFAKEELGNFYVCYRFIYPFFTPSNSFPSPPSPSRCFSCAMLLNSNQPALEKVEPCSASSSLRRFCACPGRTIFAAHPQFKRHKKGETNNYGQEENHPNNLSEKYIHLQPRMDTFLVSTS